MILRNLYQLSQEEALVTEPPAITTPETPVVLPSVAMLTPAPTPETPAPAPITAPVSVMQDVLNKALPILKLAGMLVIGNIVFPKKKKRGRRR